MVIYAGHDTKLMQNSGKSLAGWSRCSSVYGIVATKRDLQCNTSIMKYLVQAVEHNACIEMYMHG